MSVIDRTPTETDNEPAADDDLATDDELATDDAAVDDSADGTIDLTDSEDAARVTDRPPAARRRIPRPRVPRGMRISRIRLKSVMKIAAVFFVLGYIVTMATLVLLWNVAQDLGFVESIEETLVTALGLESFSIVGQDLFELAAIGFGLAFGLGLVITILLTIVYNATCALFGGLAVETGSLRRPKRVFSPRHRRFITIQ